MQESRGLVSLSCDRSTSCLPLTADDLPPSSEILTDAGVLVVREAGRHRFTSVNARSHRRHRVFCRSDCRPSHLANETSGRSRACGLAMKGASLVWRSGCRRIDIYHYLRVRSLFRKRHEYTNWQSVIMEPTRSLDHLLLGSVTPSSSEGHVRVGSGAPRSTSDAAAPG